MTSQPDAIGDPRAAGEIRLRAGNLEVRLAATPAEIDAAQALRYRVFYEEMTARPSIEIARRRRDFDSFDAYCDHLLVIDHDRGAGAEGVVGTYRLMRREAARRHGGFYTASEFDIAILDERRGEVLELGRSCVDALYRTRPTIELLWRGIAAYVFRHRIEVMFGCASLPGTDPRALALPLSYLYHYHLAPPALRVRARPERYTNMNFVAAEQIDRRGVLASLPPLVKGYLRLGGFVGDGAVVDHQFNTTDVCVVVATDRVTEKYYSHYERSVRSTEPD
jgi:putative hemolysin